MRRVAPSDLGMVRPGAVDRETLSAAAKIVDDVAQGGDDALRRYAREHDGLGDDEPLLLERPALLAALDTVPQEVRALLERTASRIECFALAQRAALGAVDVQVDGGRAGHLVAPVARAGCYAPGGRYPLPSSVLMTAVTARAAGVAQRVVATPSRSPLMLAAAAVAGADSVLRAGGAHAIAALAYGTPSLPLVDIVVGPGNRWVTAAKQLVSGRVAIDMLAGPSELVVVADESADAALVAADLLAQAEHDADALPVLVTTSSALADRVDDELGRQLASLPTERVAERALANGLSVVCRDLDEVVGACDALAPEHVEIITRAPQTILERLGHFGAAFLGPRSAEVLGDYGAGPNHVLPTGGGARFTGGLSVLTFLRVRTWLAIDDTGAAPLARDAAALARLEGLEAHARAAERRN